MNYTSWGESLNMQRFEVNRQAFTEWRGQEQAKPSLKEGEVRLAIDFFAFSPLILDRSNIRSSALYSLGCITP